MSKSLSPPSPTLGENAPPNSSNTPPRPQIPPGHNSPVRTPHPHDVLSGRGGRINSHPGNVRFREMVDAYKRDYLDHRTKKVEKARIAARIVSTVRTLEPTGRFLKEDPHTGLWVEVGDERAWKKAGQALRESAPEIRAERQAHLQMLAASAGAVVDPIIAGGGIMSGGGGGGGGGNGKSSSRKSRQADPPGPRHRPNPPEREGLARSNSRHDEHDDLTPPQRHNNRETISVSSSNRQALQSNQLPLDEDRELARMRQEYLQMQRLQLEQQRRMERYQAQLRQAQQGGGGRGVAGGAGASGISSDNSYGAQDLYSNDEYNHMQQEQLLGSYRQQVHQTAQAQLAREAQLRGGSQSGDLNQQQRYANDNHQDIAAAIMDDGLLPVNAGFDIPALRGEHSDRQLQYQQFQQQQQQQQLNQQYGTQPNYQDLNQSNAIQAQEAFDRHFNSCDKTVSTMSSFDIQSMDMSSLGGFSWNQSAYNMSGSGLISTGSNTQLSSSNRYNNNFNNASGGMSGNKQSKSKSKSGHKQGGGKSALERKLEKVNEQHRRQQMQEMQRKQQMQGGGGMAPQAHGQQMHPQGGISVPTAGGMAHQQAQQQNQRSPSNNDGRSRKYSQEAHNNMTSLTSFGFEAIEEDEFTEASYKMSNLGLSEMDMTFSSDVLSVRSKSVPKMRAGDDEEGKEGSPAQDKSYRRASTEDKNPTKSRSDGDADELNARSSGGDKPNKVGGIMASSVFNQSLSSASGTTSSSLSKNSSIANNKKPFNMSMEDFNESFKSMEVEDRSKSSKSNTGGASGGGSGAKQQQQGGRHLPDPDGAMAGGQSRYPAGGNMAPPPRGKGGWKDPSGGRLGTIHSSRSVHHNGANSTNAGAAASSANAAAANANVRLSSSNNAAQHARRESYESMGLSDPDFGGQSNTDFGVSLESLRSFQSVQSGNSDASSWLNQYNSMENIGSDHGTNPWDDEDQAHASDGTSMSEISAPRMVTATGGDAS